MSTLMFGIFGVAIALVVARQFRSGADLATWAEQAAATGSVELLVQQIEKNGEGRDTGTQWDQAINALWQSYNRETAAKVVVQGAMRCDAPVLQYWIKRIIEVHPEIAEVHFTETFMREHFRPEVAASCGGGCGCK